MKGWWEREITIQTEKVFLLLLFTEFSNCNHKKFWWRFGYTKSWLLNPRILNPSIRSKKYRWTWIYWPERFSTLISTTFRHNVLPCFWYPFQIVTFTDKTCPSQWHGAPGATNGIFIFRISVQLDWSYSAVFLIYFEMLLSSDIKHVSSHKFKLWQTWNMELKDSRCHITSRRHDFKRSN